jgi:hypothetical protein
MSDEMISSAILDSYLLDKGTWDEESRRAFREWISTADFEEKRLKASRLIPWFMQRLLCKDISEEGKVRGGRLGESLVHLEDLLIATRSGMGRKFYRDHLNHMLRVSLLANAIATQQQTFPKNSLEGLVVACLFHDIAYPLAESKTIIGQAIESMEACYKTLVFPQFSYSYAIQRVPCFLEILKTVGSESKTMGELLEAFAHNVVGGIEFLDYVKDATRFVPVLEAIVFHDSKSRSEVSIDRAPMLALLVIADEFQDWGRPVPLQEEALIRDLGQVNVSNCMVSGELDYRPESILSPFRQAHSKLQNLKRLNLQPWGMHVILRMLLPKYDASDLLGLERMIAGLWNRECSELVSLPADEGQQLFMERYYGTRISQETHAKVVQDLASGRLPESFITKKFNAFLSVSRSELLLIDKSIGCPEAVALVCGEEGHFDLVAEGRKTVKAQLYGTGDSEWKDMAAYLAEMMRIFNRLVSAEELRRQKESFLPSLGDYFLPPTHIKSRLESLGFESADLGFIDRMRDFRRAMSEGGLFILDSYDDRLQIV